MTEPRREGRFRLPYLAAVVLYLFLGLLWASVGGLHLWELRGEATPHDHVERILEVRSAGLTPDGELVLCLYGRRSACGHVESEAAAFSMSMPVDLLWSPRKDPRLRGFRTLSANPRWLLVPRERLGPACRGDGLDPVQLVRLPETDPHGYFDGLRPEQLEKLRPPEGDGRVVFEIPMSFDGAVFHEMRQVVYVSAEPDAAGLPLLRHPHAAAARPRRGPGPCVGDRLRSGRPRVSASASDAGRMEPLRLQSQPPVASS